MNAKEMQALLPSWASWSEVYRRAGNVNHQTMRRRVVRSSRVPEAEVEAIRQVLREMQAEFEAGVDAIMEE